MLSLSCVLDLVSGLQVQQLKALQQEQQQQAEDSPAPLPDATCPAGLVVPAATLCSRGSLTALSGCAPSPPPSHHPATSGPASLRGNAVAAGPQHAGVYPHPATELAGAGLTGGKGTDGVCPPGTTSRGQGIPAAVGERDGVMDAFGRELGAQLSYDCRFHAVRDSLSYGVVEAAAVAASCWGHAVSVLQQVMAGATHRDHSQ